MRTRISITILLSLIMAISLSAKSNDMTITINTIENGQRFDECTTIELGVDITVNSGEINRVYYYQNGVTLKSNRVAPYGHTWENVPGGIYVVTAKVTDKDNNEYWSDPITIFVDPIQDGDLIHNGEFECENWPWSFSTDNGSSATLTIERDGEMSGDSYAMIEVEEAATNVWDIMLWQPFSLIQGHTYEIYFMADAIVPMDIGLSIQLWGGDWVAHLWQIVTIDGLNTYGPFEIVPAEDVPSAQFRLMFGGTESNVYFIDAVTAVDKNWGEEDSTSVSSPMKQAFPGYALRQNYPNPFNPLTSIEYRIANNEHVNMTIYNALGNEVRVMVDESQSAGTYTVHWDGKDLKGQPVGSGFYFYRIESGEFTSTQKLLLMR